jgi:inhibitor of KinA sporulation pathway (predicted exonuclease)
VRSALAIGLRILRAQRNHYRQSRPAWACWCGLDTPLLKTDQCADHAPSGAYMSDRW